MNTIPNYIIIGGEMNPKKLNNARENREKKKKITSQKTNIKQRRKNQQTCGGQLQDTNQSFSFWKKKKKFIYKQHKPNAFMNMLLKGSTFRNYLENPDPMKHFQQNVTEKYEWERK